MNDKLEAFRKRLRDPEKKKASWQFWIGSPTAWLALFISSTTAFFTLFYHSDELRVAVSGGIAARLELFADEKTGTPYRGVTVSTPRRFTFINSGSRPIAVLSARIAHHHRRPPSTFPLDGLGCSFFSRSRSAQSPSMLLNIRSSNASADAVGMPALWSCLISPRCGKPEFAYARSRPE